MRSRKAFTLIELLVVIAIIAILAAILFPVFAQAREKARATSCLSNSDEMGLAVQMYVQDYDEHYPFAADLYGQYGGFADGGKWYEKIQPYVKNGQILFCPDIQKNPLYNTLSTYAYNIHLGYFYYPPEPQYTFYTGATLADVQEPAQTVVTSDDSPSVYYYNKVYGGIYGQFYSFINGTSEMYDVARFLLASPNDWYTAFIHTGGINLSYCDGHAKWNNGKYLVTYDGYEQWAVNKDTGI